MLIVRRIYFQKKKKKIPFYIAFRKFNFILLFNYYKLVRLLFFPLLFQSLFREPNFLMRQNIINNSDIFLIIFLQLSLINLKVKINENVFTYIYIFITINNSDIFLLFFHSYFLINKRVKINNG